MNGFFVKARYQIWSTSRVLFGAISFLLYITDLHLALKNSKVTIHADDTSICFSSGSVDNIKRTIKKDLQDLKIWLESSKLSLSVLNTQGMLIGTSKRLQKLKQETSIEPSFQIGDNEVKLVDNTKYLGVQADRFLNWSQHVANTCIKVSKGKILCYAKIFLPLEIIQSMYKSLIEPYFRYCIPVGEVA